MVHAYPTPLSRFFREDLLTPPPTDFKVHTLRMRAWHRAEHHGGNRQERACWPTTYASYSEGWVREKGLFAYARA